MLDQNKLWICGYKGKFSVFVPVAIITMQNGVQIEYKRFTKHGLLEWNDPVTLSVGDFLHYYRMVNEEELALVKSKVKGKGGMETWLNEKYPAPERSQ